MQRNPPRARFDRVNELYHSRQLASGVSFASQPELASVRLPHASAPDKTTIIIVNIIRLRAGSLARRSPPPLKSASASSKASLRRVGQLVSKSSAGWQMTPTLFSDLAAPRPFASPNSRKRRQQVPCALRPRRRRPPGGAARPRATCWEPGGSGAFVTAAAAAAASITVGATRTRTERDRESSSRTEEAEKNQKPFDNKQR